MTLLNSTKNKYEKNINIFSPLGRTIFNESRNLQMIKKTVSIECISTYTSSLFSNVERAYFNSQSVDVRSKSNTKLGC